MLSFILSINSLICILCTLYPRLEERGLLGPVVAYLRTFVVYGRLTGEIEFDPLASGKTKAACFARAWEFRGGRDFVWHILSFRFDALECVSVAILGEYFLRRMILADTVSRPFLDEFHGTKKALLMRRIVDRRLADGLLYLLLCPWRPLLCHAALLCLRCILHFFLLA